MAHAKRLHEPHSAPNSTDLPASSYFAHIQRPKNRIANPTLSTGDPGRKFRKICAESDLLPICTFDIDGSFDKDITYTVVETKAKEDYILDSTPHEVVFTYGRDEDGKLKEDEKAPEVVEYTLDLTNKPTQPKLPQTGDNYNPFVCGAIGLAFILFAVSYIFFSKKTSMVDDIEEYDDDIEE